MDIDIFIPAHNLALETAQILSNQLKMDLFKKNVRFNNVKNRPHISLYQLKVDGCHIESIKNTVDNLAKAHSRFSFKMNETTDLVGQNIFWRSEEALHNQELLHLLKQTVENIKRFKSQDILPQITSMMSSLTAQQKAFIGEYGVFWGLPHNFDPHITLVYNIDPTNNDLYESPELETQIPFLAEEICIGIIGYHGNIEQTIYSSPFLQSNSA